MKYYVVSDIHSFYSELKKSLTEKGFFEDKEPHKLIVLGDLFDRGTESLELQEFIMSLIKKDEVILIRGNHEDLIVEFVKNIREWMSPIVYYSHHGTNGTVDTVLQLTGMKIMEAIINPDECAERMKSTPFFQTILPKMLNYYETEKYIFVHGWIPCQVVGKEEYYYETDWRMFDEEKWRLARWYNGMLAAYKGVVEKGKTIICGHWHSSYGHTCIEGKGEEFGKNADFSPYYGKGVIAIDGCTIESGMVNCIVIEDESCYG